MFDFVKTKIEHFFYFCGNKNLSKSP